MKLTQKLLGLLHRVFDPDPERFLALRLSYAGSMTWAVSNAVLTTTVTGGPGQSLTIDLTAYTLRQLVNYLSEQPGYDVLSAGNAEQLSLGARVLIDATGDIANSNGDHLYGYTSLAWAFLEPAAVELRAARKQIPEAIKQLSIGTASDDWLDELGSYYGVGRFQGESDGSYGPRIIAEVVRPRSNNVAIEAAISYYTGQKTTVTDVVVYGDIFPKYNGAVTRNSAYNYQSTAQPRYGLFDVEYGYDLLGDDNPTDFAGRVEAIIDKLRAAGTHLRALSLKSGAITDTFTEPVDGAMTIVASPILEDLLTAPTENEVELVSSLDAMADSLEAPNDDTTGTIVYSYRYNSVRTRNGAINYMGGQTGPL